MNLLEFPICYCHSKVKVGSRNDYPSERLKVRRPMNLAFDKQHAEGGEGRPLTELVLCSMLGQIWRIFASSTTI